MATIAAIRDAHIGEQAALSDLHRRSSFVWEEDRGFLAAHPDALGVERETIAAGRVRVAVGLDGRPLAFAIVTRAPDGIRVLEDLFVEPGQMRRGIGRSLVRDAAERAAAEGAHTMTVVAHPRNFAFYESVGFVAAGPAATRFGPATLMSCELAGLRTRPVP